MLRLSWKGMSFPLYTTPSPTDGISQLYTPGPAETLANFEVHLKNRLHRSKVNARVQGITPPP